MEKLSKENLDNYGIYDIRNIARKIGVKSPTALKRDELIEKILAITSGEILPQQNTNKVGRPPKISNIKDEYVFDVNASTLNPDFQNVCVASKSEPLGMLMDATGIVKFFPEGYAILFDLRGCDYPKIILNNQLCSKYNFISGDIITVQYRKNPSNNNYYGVNVLKINDQDESVFENIVRKSFYSLQSVFPTKQLELQSSNQLLKMINVISPIAYGSRNLINISNEIDDNEFVIDLIKSLKNFNKEDILLEFIDEMPETRHYFNEISNLCTITSEKEYNEQVYYLEEFEALVKRIKNRAMYNNGSVLIIKNLNTLINFCKSYLKLKERINDSEAYLKSLLYLKNIFLYAKNTESNNTLTLIVINVNNNSDAIDYLDVFNNIVNIDYKVNKFSENLVNPFTSRAKREKQIMTEENYNKLCLFRENLTDENQDILPIFNKIVK